MYVRIYSKPQKRHAGMSLKHAGMFLERAVFLSNDLKIVVFSAKFCILFGSTHKTYRMQPTKNDTLRG